jgi:hypothetical protein
MCATVTTMPTSHGASTWRDTRTEAMIDAGQACEPRFLDTQRLAAA